MSDFDLFGRPTVRSVLFSPPRPLEFQYSARGSAHSMQHASVNHVSEVVLLHVRHPLPQRLTDNFLERLDLHFQIGHWLRATSAWTYGCGHTC